MKLKNYLLLESENTGEDYSSINTFYVRKGSDTKDQKALRSKALNSPSQLLNDLGVKSPGAQDDPIKSIYKVLAQMLTGPLSNEFRLIFRGLKNVNNKGATGVVVSIQPDALADKEVGDVRSARKDYAFWIWSAVVASNLSYNIFNRKSSSHLRVEGVSGKNELLVYFSKSKWN